MTDHDKIHNKVDETAGRAKEAAGHATGDEELRQQGESEKDRAQLKDRAQDAVDKAKEIFKK